MLKIIIADDNEEIRGLLKEIVGGIPGTIVAGEAGNGVMLVEMVEEIKPDVVFIDVDMPVMDGIRAAREIYNFDPNISIVFATGYDNFTHEAFEVYAFDYIMKPFKIERVIRTIKRAMEQKAEQEYVNLIEQLAGKVEIKPRKIKVQSNEHFTIVDTGDIIFVTREERKTAIHTVNGTISTYEPMEKLYQRLKNDNFFRCHKGYIINTDMVTELAPWGHKTYLVKLAHTKETALMTLEKAKEFQDLYCVE